MPPRVGMRGLNPGYASQGVYREVYPSWLASLVGIWEVYPSWLASQGVYSGYIPPG